MIGEYYNEDCMSLMSRYKDKHFDLAIVDPPYGIKGDRFFITKSPSIDPRNGRVMITKPKRIGNWDNERPNKKYFEELIRVSKNQIIWGGNYFADLLLPKSCWIVWDKVNGRSDQADCELAWTSFNTAVRQIEYMWCIAQGKSIKEGRIAQGNNKLWEKKIHPTQKPIKLYEWVLQNYSKESDTILDTHVGSASSLIACENMKRKYVGCELDKDYYNESLERLKFHIQSNNYDWVF